MKKIFLSLAAVAAVAAFIWSAAGVDAQAPGGAPPAAPAAQAQQPRSRIALVNIATVMRRFELAAQKGKAIGARKQSYSDQQANLTEQINKLQRDMALTPKPEEKEAISRRAKELVRQREDVVATAQKELSELSDKTIVELYQDIKSVIEAVAVANNLELVMCYPDASTAEEDHKPQVAALKLQATALIPYYHRNMDVTEVVILTLNRRHPVQPVAKTGPGATPTNGIQPVGGVAPR